MFDQPRNLPEGWSWRHIACVLCVATFVVYWPLKSDYLCERDAPEIAIASRSFDISVSGPHPPGYPLSVLATSCLARFLGDPNTALIAMSIGFTAGAAFFLFRLAFDVGGISRAVWVTGIFILTPNVVLYNTIGSMSTVDLFTSCATAWYATRLWQGDKKSGVYGAILLGVLAGFRIWGTIWMLPVFVYSLVVACRGDWRTYLKVAVAFAGAFLYWFVPIAVLSDGLGRALSDVALGFGEIVGYVAGNSMVNRNSLTSHLERLVREVIWLAFSLVVPGCLAVGLRVARRWSGRERIPRAARAGWDHWLFFTLWVVPHLLTLVIVDGPKPGYLILSLPPLLLLLGGRIHTEVGVLSQAHGRVHYWPGILAGSVFLVATVILASYPYGTISARGFAKYRQTLQEASWGYARKSDQAVAEFLGLVRASGTQNAEQMFVILEPEQIALGGGSSNYYFPECPGCELTENGLYETLDGEHIHTAVSTMTKRIWWNLPCRLSAEPILTAFPETRLMLSGDLRSYYLTEIGAKPLETAFCFRGTTYPLYRAVGAEFGSGFSEIEEDGFGNRFIWAMGPECEMALGIERSMQVSVRLDVFSSPTADQKLTISFNEQESAVVRIAAKNPAILLSFDAVQGINRLRFVFAKWNGAPTAVIPADPRPLAIAFRQITLRLEDGREAKLLLPK